MVVEPGSDLDPSPATLDVLTAALRPALRASDLVGEFDGRLLVVMVHAHAEAASAAGERLGRRLAAAASDLAGAVRVGSASFSPSCRSLEGLISSALQASRPIPPR